MSFYETRAVLAGAYKGQIRETLTHTLQVDDPNYVKIRVLCANVKLDSLCDPYGSDRNAKPTCYVCARHDPRWKPLPLPGARGERG